MVAALVLILSCAALLCLGYQALALTHRYPLDYGEAPLLDQAMRLAAGGALYRAELSSPPYTISNYPPLYVMLLAPFVKLFGPSFFFGRLLSALGAWISAALLGWMVHLHTRDRLAAATTGLLFLALPYVVHWSSLLRVDLLALALSLGALALLVHRPDGRWSFRAAVVLLVGAIATRQTYALAAPLAACAWLFVRDRRRALQLAALVGGTSLAGFALLNGLTHGGFYFNIVTANVNEFDPRRLAWNLGRLLETAPVLLCASGVALFLLPRRNPLWPLAAPYAVGAACSALTIGKIGSNVNYLLEFCAAMSLATGLVVAWSRKAWGLAGMRVVLFVVLIGQTGHLLRTTHDEFAVGLMGRRASAAELRQLETLVLSTTLPVLADEYMGLLTLQRRPIGFQPFEMTQLARMGRWDQSRFLERLRGQEFAYIILYRRPWVSERWTPEMRQAMADAYVPACVLAENEVYRSPKHTTDRGLAGRAVGSPRRR